MFRQFIRLEWKSFTRASSFAGNMALKVFMILGAIYFGVLFLIMGLASYHIIKEQMGQDPLVVVNKFIIYYLVLDLLIRFFLQKVPVINIRPLLTLPIKRSTIVNFALGKTALSFFNILHCFFFIPFSVMLIINGYDVVNVILWHLGIIALIYANNFLNLLIYDKDWLFWTIAVILAAVGIVQYYSFFDITIVTSVFYQGMYSTYYVFLIPIVVLAFLWITCFKLFSKELYLDTGLKGKHEIAETQDYTWLNKFGTLGTFLKNDIKLLRRNKRSKTTLIMSVAFIFYGLLFFTSAIEIYDGPFWKMFAGIFVSGGFMFTFGQFVPSWDSAYYPLMMSQNIQYKEYISSKWWLVVIGTVISAVVAAFYLYFGVETYLMILAGAIYNIGVNSHLVLLGGAYIKTPIDLASSKQAFGDKKAFNVKTLLLSVPKILLPVALYAIGYYFMSPEAGMIIVVAFGVLGFAFRNWVFSMIEKVYKIEKYKTLAAYKQKN
ncbi:hypothetical protein AMR72_10000 [Flavobacterium psychrophilum]|nr:hypothetical protein AMR72_10000 [Flavobacterium psychrophilum]AOE52811.1 hypothetical protein ALW18_09990 [Flavobacterium psychrophilum]